MTPHPQFDERGYWVDALARMARVIAAKTRGLCSREDVEDLTSKARKRLERALERGGIRSMEAIQYTVAKRTAIDFLRLRRPKLTSIEDVPGLPAPDPSEEPVAEAIEIQFYMREALKRLDASCRALFECWLQHLNLRKVAELLGLTHDNARQRWRRCRGRALELLGADDSELGNRIREHLEDL